MEVDGSVKSNTDAMVSNTLQTLAIAKCFACQRKKEDIDFAQLEINNLKTALAEERQALTATQKDLNSLRQEDADKGTRIIQIERNLLRACEKIKSHRVSTNIMNQNNLI